MNRKVSTTQMNENSSRSHTVFTIILERMEKGIFRKSRLCFVDLAGSERLKEQGLERRQEMCNINKSLLCLGKIVNKLSSNDYWYISYRDSKLTFLLKDSLGGNSHLVIIGTIRPDCISETINTLQFLQRSKMIRNNPLRSCEVTESAIVELNNDIKRLEEENQKLRGELNKGDFLGSIKLAGPTEPIKNIRTEVDKLRGILVSVVEYVDNISKNYFDKNRNILLDIEERVAMTNKNRKKSIEEIGQKRIQA
jgi:kinesin family protein 15